MSVQQAVLRGTREAPLRAPHEGIVYEVMESKVVPFGWQAVGINRDAEGEVFVVIFVGPDARERAEEYARWKAGQGT
jgi:hypothetical protein